MLSVRESWVGPAALIGAAVIWGFFPVATRYAERTLTPGQMLLAQSLFAAVALAPYIALARPPMPARRHVPRAVALGLLGTFGFGVPITYGMQHVEAGTAALLSGTSPIFIAALSVAFLGERAGARLAGGLLLALAGSMAVAAVGDAGFGVARDELLGSALVLLSSVLWGIYSVAAKPWLGRIPPASLPVLGRIASLPLALPLGASGFVAALGELSWRGWLAVLAFSIGAGVIAQVLFAVGLQHTPAAQAGMYLYLTPLFGVLGGIVFLSEALQPVQLAGGALILAGVAIATLAPRRRRAVAADVAGAHAD
jgi:drug/metabolite transporter (DMT)-like permease